MTVDSQDLLNQCVLLNNTCWSSQVFGRYMFIKILVKKPNKAETSYCPFCLKFILDSRLPDLGDGLKIFLPKIVRIMYPTI
jgi:hypothetical protein